MLRAVKKLILTISMTPLLIACCNEETYEVSISGMESRALVLDGIDFIAYEPESAINKEELLIEVLIKETEQITSTEETGNYLKESKVVKAAVVPCADQVLLFKNRIESLKVEIRDPENSSTTLDITDQLQVKETNQSITEYLSENSPGVRGFLLEFTDVSNIPDRMQYFLEATLDDGTQINTESEVILFN